jgi:hypothetical protein
MTARLNLETATVAQNANFRADAAPSLHRSEQSFRAGWQSLLGLDKMAENQTELNSSDTNEPSIEPTHPKSDPRDNLKDLKGRRPINPQEIASPPKSPPGATEKLPTEGFSNTQLANPGATELNSTPVQATPLPSERQRLMDQRESHTTSSPGSRQTTDVKPILSHQYSQNPRNQVISGSPIHTRNDSIPTEGAVIERPLQSFSVDEPDVLQGAQPEQTALIQGAMIDGVPVGTAVPLAPNSPVAQCRHGEADSSQSTRVATAPAEPRNINESKDQIQAPPDGVSFVHSAITRPNTGGAIPSTVRGNRVSARVESEVAFPAFAGAISQGHTNTPFSREFSSLQEGVHRDERTGPPASLLNANQGTTQQTFAALDANDRISTTKWLHLTGNNAEAGFEDPTLGWIGVRAEVAPDGVHAILVPGSSEAAHSLGTHLSALNAYLSENRTPVETLTMGAPDSSLGHHAREQSAGQGPGQGRHQNEGSERPAEVVGEPAIFASRTSASTPVEQNANLLPQKIADEGMYISVVA